jgi:hypothetical protein
MGGINLCHPEADTMMNEAKVVWQRGGDSGQTLSFWGLCWGTCAHTCPACVPGMDGTLWLEGKDESKKTKMNEAHFFGPP